MGLNLVALVKQADHGVGRMLLGSYKVVLHPLEKGADGFTFAHLDSEGDEIDALADQARLAGDRLFRGGQGDDETALLRDAGEEDGHRTKNRGEEAATLLCGKCLEILRNGGRNRVIGAARVEFAAAAYGMIGWKDEDALHVTEETFGRLERCGRIREFFRIESAKVMDEDIQRPAIADKVVRGEDYCRGIGTKQNHLAAE